MYFYTLFLLAVAALTFASEPTHADNFFQQRALDPIKLQTGLPEAASRLRSKQEVQIGFVHNNVFMGGFTPTERLLLDGESSQLTVRYRRRLNDCWQMNLNGSWLAHSEGWFDQPVDDWHQLFGLPDAHRGDWPTDQLDYEYEVGQSQQAINSADSGPGDAQIQFQRYLGCVPDATLIRFGLKLPIGEPEQFTGNGAFDAFIDMQSPWWRSKKYSSWTWAGSVGVLRSGSSELLVEQKRLIGFGVIGTHFALTARTQLLAQIDWHTPMFESDLRELGTTGAQLTLGLRFEPNRRSSWEFSFSEDVAIDTAPDIAIRLSWLRRFGP